MTWAMGAMFRTPSQPKGDAPNLVGTRDPSHYVFNDVRVKTHYDLPVSQSFTSSTLSKHEAAPQAFGLSWTFCLSRLRLGLA